jgi:hypothetical protein
MKSFTCFNSEIQNGEPWLEGMASVVDDYAGLDDEESVGSGRLHRGDKILSPNRLTSPGLSCVSKVRNTY